MDKLLLTTMTPVYQGAAFLKELVGELGSLRDRLEREGSPLQVVESIFVDDSARDGSAALLERLAEAHPWVRPVSLSRNFGQHPATVAGILHSSGD